MRTLLIITIVAFSINGFGQIGGLSSAKISSLTASVIPDKSIEFEPGFYHSRSSRFWDANSNLQNTYSTPDSISLITGMYFRVTYGLWNKLEIGVSISNDLSETQWGLRYKLFQNNKLGLAIISGVNLPWGNKPINEKLRVSSNIPKAGLGVVGSFYHSPKLSYDFSAQYLNFLQQPKDKDRGEFIVSFDAGYYIFKNQVQLLGAATYRHVNNTSISHEVLTLTPGFSVETGKNYALALAFPFDVYGKRETKNTAINFALTLNFN
jgi:hypothetical protein